MPESDAAPGRREGAEVTSTKGEPLPPTKTKGTAYTLVDQMKHKSRA